MRAKVRPIEPPSDPADLEQLAADRPPLRAADLGPNGDVVMDLLERAAHLMPADCRRLEQAAGWRWWVVTPLPGTTMPAARAAAQVRGRAEGRGPAIAALESGVVAIARRLGATGGRSRLPAVISNAGLAVLVRDLVEPETFETLFGPWREVMHH
jgi:hypothetical protein